jgi:hypothetical protein
VVCKGVITCALESLESTANCLHAPEATGYFHIGSIYNSTIIGRLQRILTMVYVVQNSQNFSGLFPSSGIPKNTTFRKLDLFPSSGEGGGEDTYLRLGLSKGPN